MRYSNLLIPTVKEVPAEAEIPSHQLMIRAGFIRKVASGTYTYLPLGWKCLLKVIAIIRQEMNAAGAQEILAPILQPIELWQQTGRDKDYGQNLCVFTDRHGRANALAPTAEEVFTSLVASEINSYKQLPVTLYQINTKFRDEFRPRFGVLRSREFIMKDAYSFHTSVDDLNKTYDVIYNAYCRIFARCGLKYAPVEADSGPIGGSASHEFMVTCSAGEDTIVHAEDMSYAANIEKAEVDAPPANPELAGLRAAVGAPVKIHTPNVGTIEDVCKFMSTKPHKMIKTLVFSRLETPMPQGILRITDQYFDAMCSLIDLVTEGSSSIEVIDALLKLLNEWRESVKESPTDDALGRMTLSDAIFEYIEKHKEILFEKNRQEADQKIAACYQLHLKFKQHLKVFLHHIHVVLVRGDHLVNEAKLASLAGPGLALAHPQVVRNIIGAEIGFAGPMNLVGKVGVTIIDHLVAAMVSGITGANKTDFHVKNIVPGRDFPLTGDNVVIADIRNAAEGDTHNGKPLKFSRGIEVGHVFKLGTKYSEKLGAKFLDEKQESHPCIMGCYGIGVNRILASAIEMAYDENGCILPISIAPFEVEIVPINADKPEVKAEAERIYNELAAKGLEVLLDDRDARPGVKFKDADLIGIPLRVVVGEKGLKEGKVELKRRTDAKPTLIATDAIVAEVLQIIGELKQALKV